MTSLLSTYARLNKWDGYGAVAAEVDAKRIVRHLHVLDRWNKPLLDTALRGRAGTSRHDPPLDMNLNRSFSSRKYAAYGNRLSNDKRARISLYAQIAPRLRQEIHHLDRRAVLRIMH